MSDPLHSLVGLTRISDRTFDDFQCSEAFLNKLACCNFHLHPTCCLPADISITIFVPAPVSEFTVPATFSGNAGVLLGSRYDDRRRAKETRSQWY